MAKPRVPFSQLKPDTRTRKERWYAKHQGLTAKQVQQRYDAGTLGNQQGSRGHARTPEHPGERPKSKDQQYRDRKRSIVDIVFQFKYDHWGRRPRWNAGRARRTIQANPDNGKIRGIKELRVILAMVNTAVEGDLDSWHDIVALDFDYESAFYYH